MSIISEGFDLSVLIQQIILHGTQWQANATLQHLFATFRHFVEARKNDTNCNLLAVDELYKQMARDIVIFAQVITGCMSKFDETKVSMDKHRFNMLKARFDAMFVSAYPIEWLLTRINNDKSNLQLYAPWRFTLFLLCRKCFDAVDNVSKTKIFNSEKYKTLLEKCQGVDFVEQIELFCHIIEQTKLQFGISTKDAANELSIYQNDSLEALFAKLHEQLNQKHQQVLLCNQKKLQLSEKREQFASENDSIVRQFDRTLGDFVYPNGVPVQSIIVPLPIGYAYEMAKKKEKEQQSLFPYVADSDRKDVDKFTSEIVNDSEKAAESKLETETTDTIKSTKTAQYSQIWMK